MKMVIAGAIVALLSSSAVHARELPAPGRIATPGCVNVPMVESGAAEAVRQSTDAGTIPCPQYLSTTAIPRSHTPQRT